eukprot:690847-Prorocentrum_minimum.AAC.1
MARVHSTLQMLGFPGGGPPGFPAGPGGISGGRPALLGAPPPAPAPPNPMGNSGWGAGAVPMGGCPPMGGMPGIPGGGIPGLHPGGGAPRYGGRGP